MKIFLIIMLVFGMLFGCDVESAIKDTINKAKGQSQQSLGTAGEPQETGIVSNEPENKLSTTNKPAIKADKSPVKTSTIHNEPQKVESAGEKPKVIESTSTAKSTSPEIKSIPEVKHTYEEAPVPSITDIKFVDKKTEQYQAVLDTLSGDLDVINEKIDEHLDAEGNVIYNRITLGLLHKEKVTYENLALASLELARYLKDRFNTQIKTLQNEVFKRKYFYEVIDRYQNTYVFAIRAELKNGHRVVEGLYNDHGHVIGYANQHYPEIFSVYKNDFTFDEFYDKQRIY